MDPHAENYLPVSPYAYVGNNPIVRIDPDGRDWYEDKEGNKMWRRSKDESYTDDDGNEWNNIGAEHTFVFGKKAVYFGQNEDEDGNLSLFSSTIDFKDTEWADFSSQINSAFGSVASGLGLQDGSFRLTNGAYNGNQFSFKYYSSGWQGGSRAIITTYKLSQIGKVLGGATFVAGLTMDAIGVVEHYRNPGSQHAVHPNKAALNTMVALYGFYNPYFSVPYFMFDNFYPGGWQGALNDRARLERETRKIVPGFQLNPRPLF